jgi:hypothetical protein
MQFFTQIQKLQLGRWWNRIVDLVREVQPTCPQTSKNPTAECRTNKSNNQTQTDTKTITTTNEHQPRQANNNLNSNFEQPISLFFTQTIQQTQWLPLKFRLALASTVC